MAKKRNKSIRDCRNARELERVALAQGAWIENGGQHPKICTDLGKVPYSKHGNGQQYGKPLISRIAKQLAAIGITLFVGLFIAAQYVAGGM